MNLYKLHLDAISSEPALADRRYVFPFPEDIYPTSIPEEVLTEKFFSELFRKNPFIDIGIDKDQVAKDSFFDGERRCASYNASLGALINKNIPLKAIMSIHRDLVSRMIGKLPRFQNFLGITSGATDNIGRGNNPINRFMECNITPSLFGWFTNYGPPTPFVPWDWRDISIVQGNVSLSVPKSLTTNRLVCPEPACNATVQREIGVHLSRKLKIWGCSIPDGQERHKRMAKEASVSNLFTTDDQSNASGHIYVEFVKNSVSDEWFNLLDCARSHKTYFDSTPISHVECFWTNHGFMTQGNGFCFELETVLFLCLIRATSIYYLGRDLSCLEVSVFGDDAIYPSGLTFYVRKVFKAVGFVINENKSYSDSNFRESCGGDYINGHAVRTPFFKNEGLSSFEMTVRANQIFLWLEEHPEYEFRMIKKYRLDLIRCIPVRDRLWGPKSLGDSVLITDKKSLWRVSTVGRQRHLRIRTWSSEPIQYQSIGDCIFDGAKPNNILALASVGLLKGLGYRNHYLEGPEGQKYAKYKAPGSPEKVVKKTVFFTDVPSAVNHDDPMDVFRPGVLNMPVWVYNQHSYDAYRTRKRQEFLGLLRSLVGKKGVFDIFNIEMELDL